MVVDLSDPDAFVDEPPHKRLPVPAAPLAVEGDLARARLQPYEIGTWVVQLA